jgi:hypothetical protein
VDLSSDRLLITIIIKKTEHEASQYIAFATLLLVGMTPLVIHDVGHYWKVYEFTDHLLICAYNQLG